MRRIREGRLIKVEVFNDGNSWSMQWEKGHYVHRGDADSFAKLLMKIKASDDRGAPKSNRSMTYVNIAKEIQNGTDRFIWVFEHVLRKLWEHKEKREKKNLLNEKYEINVFRNDYQMAFDSYLIQPYEAKGYQFVGIAGTSPIDYIHLFKLTSFDRDYTSGVTLRAGEFLFRYITKTTVAGGMMPLVKINVDRGIIYYLTEDASENSIPEFKDKGKKLKFLGLLEESAWDYVEPRQVTIQEEVNIRKIVRRLEEKDPKAEKIIKDLAKSYGSSNEERGKMIQLLRGLAFSDDPEANKFMKALDKWTTEYANKKE